MMKSANAQIANEFVPKSTISSSASNMPPANEYTQEIADKICLRLSQGESLRSICRDSEFPAQSTVFKWLTEQKAFSERYAQAQERKMEAWQESLDEIADEALAEVKKCDDPKIASALVQAYRAKIDTRKWSMSKLAPKKYGEKIQQEHSGELGIKTIVVSQDRKKAQPKPDVKPEF